MLASATVIFTQMYKNRTNVSLCGRKLLAKYTGQVYNIIGR